ncbi:receptor-like protein 7 [Cornus florida]|uniref:receptor-like protein 7 n=1 Tax=Cornus florida TaxID=4283 RepID=UPI0028996415|nr:receptor-like protein 7 [Cornus florida]XP_059641817.1 receptor-like protein 7 [Cornus florida]
MSEPPKPISSTLVMRCCFIYLLICTHSQGCLSQLCPMRIQLLSSWLFLIPLFTILFCTNPDLVSGQCLDHHQSLLVQFKNSLQFNPSVSTKLINWNESTDCCHWSGVSCDNTTGRVIGLDLSSESISGGFDNSSALFSFESLQSLNLANNSFNFTQIPERFRNLTSLTYLNLSNAGFAGQIPMELSSMTRLVTLDLSTFFPEVPLKLDNPNLSRLVQNLTELREILLDGVNISAQGKEWCQALSSSLPNLEVLSLSNCNLSGPIDSDLLKLRSLSVISLNQNNLSTTVPEFFTNFTNLTVLSLGNCNLQGMFQDKIFQVSTLQTLDLSNNEFLSGSLPEFHHYGSLEHLVLSDTNFSGRLPNSIDNLRMLSWIELFNCNLSGPIPNSVANLTRLVYLDLSTNMFIGPIPSFHKLKSLTHIDLSRNFLRGSIPPNHFEGLQNLVYIDLRYNSFNGSIPSSLLAIQSLQKIQLSFNQFGGQVPEYQNASSSPLNTLDLSNNNFEGPIPMSVFELKSLNVLLLSSNNFTTIKLESFTGLPNLTTLDLSHNSLSIDTSGSSSSLFSFPQIHRLRLASCKLQSFPNLQNLSGLYELDLSHNQIDGKIPNWIWKIGDGTLNYLNLSYNLLVDVQQPYTINPTIIVLDLHSNQFGGKIPKPPEFAAYVDYSSNNFSSFIPADIGDRVASASFFSLANNSLTGVIPDSLCNARHLLVLDLSNNHLNGAIPSCIAEMSGRSLAVLNLQKNKLSGNISGTFPLNCGLKNLDLNANHLEGQVPQSLANCTMIEVLNIGNNNISGNFPCFLKNSSSLQVLVLRSNRFQGGIRCQGSDNNSWPNLQIIDLASNYFSGNLPRKYFLNWRAMMVDKINYARFEFLRLSPFYYQYTVRVTNKGQEMDLVKILTIFTSIDFSNNKFQGKIPDTVGNLKLLYVLNLSNNGFTGSIPASMGNLKQLGSLDLSMNKLNGVIPIQLASLTFLPFLNLSYNLLVGQIPKGSQFQTFSETSFEGNEGLCGFPFGKNCSNVVIPPISSPTLKDNHSYPESEVYLSAELGFVVGLGIIIGPLLFCRRWSFWYFNYVDRIFLRNIIHQQEQRRRKRRAYRNPIQPLRAGE